VTHAWSLALIALASNADSLVPMISLKRWISRLRSCVSDILVVPTNARDLTLELHAIMRSHPLSTKPHRVIHPRPRNLTHWHKIYAIDCTNIPTPPGAAACRCPGGSWPRLSQLARLRFRLLQPEVHVHFTVHRRGSGEVFAGLLPTAGALIQLAKAEVTVGGDAPAR
jgi:hypothetical protein